MKTFIMIGGDNVSALVRATQIHIRVTAMVIHYFSVSCEKKLHDRVHAVTKVTKL